MSKASRAWLVIVISLALVVVAGAAIVVGLSGSGSSGTSTAQGQTGQAAPGAAASSAAAANPGLDLGSALSGPAPDFTLTDQFGQPVSLHSQRGKAVILAFVDSECTTVCPLTTVSMVDAKQLLGAAASQVSLIAVDANPQATTTKDVYTYSQMHGVLHQWRFLTGSLAQLNKVWADYHIAAQINQGLIDHTPALYVINPAGDLVRIYLTQMSYESVPQQAQVLAEQTAQVLPGHPKLASTTSLAYIKPATPDTTVTLQKVGGGTLKLGPGSTPRLTMFFASWLSETSPLVANLEGLNAYPTGGSSAAPPLVAVDEGSVEPSPDALGKVLTTLTKPLSYPVVVDPNGRVADGYGVQDQPWFVLTSPAGKVLWSHDGWLTPAQLTHDVQAALAK